MYAAFPMFLYFDSSLGGLLLEPLLRYQAWPNVNPHYTARDAGKVFFFRSQCTSLQIYFIVGTSYPNTSIPETHDQGIERKTN